MNLLFFLVAIVLGLCAGTITGMVPGLHVNTLGVGMLAIAPFILEYFGPLAAAAFLIAMATVHTFVDAIPSLFLGAPDPAMALSVLPGHDMLNKGLGYRALKLTVIGGLGTFIICVASLPLLFLILKPVEPVLKSILPFILLFLVVVFIYREGNTRQRIWAAIVFILAGVLGLLTLNHLNIAQGLFPMLAGLFGISALLIAMQRQCSIPPQATEADVSFIQHIPNYLRAAISSLFVSVLPAVGASQAAYMAKGFQRSSDKEGFLVTIGGINTAAVVFTLSALILLGKTRTGIMVVLKEFLELDRASFIALIFVSIGAAIFGAVVALRIGKWFIKNMEKINYRKISLGIIILVSSLVALISGFLGLLILIVATAIGLLAPLAGVRRIHAMGCLVLVVLIQYI